MIKSLLNIIFPKICSGCKSILLENENTICTNCRHELPLTQFFLNPENEAFKKFYGRISADHVSSFLYFNKAGIVQELIHSLKYRGHEAIGTVLGNWYAEDLKTLDFISNVDLILPVPLHAKRLRERGFNQVTTFGKALSISLKIPYDESVLYRKKYAKKQAVQVFEKRTQINEDVFDVYDNFSCHNKHFLLIDDVLTTGATLEACARAVLKIPGSKISIITIAMTH